MAIVHLLALFHQWPLNLLMKILKSEHFIAQFHHVPLYLEWAPMEVFTSPPPQTNIQKPSDETSEEKMDAEVNYLF